MKKSGYWAGCPEPLPLEVLSSWLIRVAGYYRMKPEELLVYGTQSSGLQFHQASSELTQLDHYADVDLLRSLSSCSGVSFHRLRAMTLARWVAPIAIGYTKRPSGPRPYFTSYVRGFRVLRKVGPGAAIKRPSLPWEWPIPWDRTIRWCEQCRRGDEQPYDRITWRFRLVRTCPVHSCELAESRPAGGTTPLRPVDHKPLLQLDWMTTQALRHGAVMLPSGRPVSAGLWLRLLRGMVDDLMRVEEHHWEGFLRAPLYDQIWLLSRALAPRLSSRWFEFESEDSGFGRQYHEAAACLLELLLEGKVAAIAGRRARAIFQ